MKIRVRVWGLKHSLKKCKLYRNSQSSESTPQMLKKGKEATQLNSLILAHSTQENFRT